MLNTGNLSVMSDGLRNAAQALDNFTSDNYNFTVQEQSFQEGADFRREGEDLILSWYHTGVQREVSMNSVYDFINGGVATQLNQLLETVSNLEEKIEAMEYYNEESEQAA